MKRLIMIAVVGLLLGSCGEVKPPKRGPVEAVGGFSPRGTLKIISSINCAVPGEEVVFDLELTNNEPLPLTLLGTPLIEIVLDGWGKDILWSQSSSYPPDINPVLQPGEQRQYQWRWVATDVEGQMAAVVVIDVKSPVSAASRPIKLILPMGINTMSWEQGGVDGPIACSELR